MKDADSFKQEVMIDGLRPTVDGSWPNALQQLLQRMWSSDSAKRPSSTEVVKCLGGILRGDDCDLFPVNRSILYKVRF